MPSPLSKVERGFALWFTGLPAAGKTTVATALRRCLDRRGVTAILLDGDELRPVLCKDLGHSEGDRYESLLRYVGLSRLLAQSKVITIFAIINHAKRQRDVAREAHPPGHYGEVWIKTPLDVCKRRDPKSLYRRATRMDQPASVVGVDIDYEEPDNADIVVETVSTDPDEAARRIVGFLVDAGVLTDLE